MVELINYFGGDKSICDVARVSYAKKAENYTEEQNAKLISYLIKHKHTSPLRHSSLQFRVRCPLYVERQIFKHSVGISVNSLSGRYVDFSDSYHLIHLGEWRKQSKSSKQGSEGVVENQERCIEIQSDIIKRARDSYEELLELGVSKEQARSILPLALETEFIWTGTFLAFIHLCDLRLKEDTQKETRDVVGVMLELVKNIESNPFKETLKAFNYE